MSTVVKDLQAHNAILLVVIPVYTHIRLRLGQGLGNH